VVLPDHGPLAADLEAGGIEVLVRPLGVLRRALLGPAGLARVSLAAARDAAALARLARRRGVALIHSNTSVVLGGAAAAGAARIPHIWHVREIYSGFERTWPAYRRLLGTARALPCVSRATAAQFPPWGRIKVIPDGVALAAARGSRGEARRLLELPPHAPVIAVVARISPWKGQDVLVRALAQPELQERRAIGLIAGDTWSGTEDRVAGVLALATRLGVADRIRLVGFRDDVATVYDAADVIAVPSTAPDPLPGAAIEAAGAGRAVIASDIGGLPEIIREGVTGRLVAPGDPAALARAARALIDDPGECDRLGAAAAADVRERFAPERLLEAIQRLYDSV
jgi:glycosyltransferase involved in cell wall biosynthesis